MRNVLKTTFIATALLTSSLCFAKANIVHDFSFVLKATNSSAKSYRITYVSKGFVSTNIGDLEQQKVYIPNNIINWSMFPRISAQNGSEDVYFSINTENGAGLCDYSFIKSTTSPSTYAISVQSSGLATCQIVNKGLEGKPQLVIGASSNTKSK